MQTLTRGNEVNMKEAKQGRVLSGGSGKRCGSCTSTWKKGLPNPKRMRKENSFCETPKLPWPLDNGRIELSLPKPGLLPPHFSLSTTSPPISAKSALIATTLSSNRRLTRLDLALIWRPHPQRPIERGQQIKFLISSSWLSVSISITLS